MLRANNLVFVSFLFIFIVLGSIGGCNNNNNRSQRTVVVNSETPSDIPGGSQNADLREAAIFAWQEFIALNWPALSGTRDTPDNNLFFGEPGFEGPLVWQTYRHKVEIYPGSGNPPGFVNNPAQDFGYNTVPPQYVYEDGEVDPCDGQAPVNSPAWVNLDEISQIGLDSMFAGASPSQSDVNGSPQLIRFLAKGNREHYVYVVDPVLSLWNHTSSPSDEPYWDLVDNFTAVADGNGDPSTLPGPVIEFPDGMIEVKAAFRELTDAEKNSGRFYTTVVRYYEQDDSDPDKACYREAVWGLTGLHIIHKTPTAPNFIFATFEQADNLLTQNGQPVEDDDGNVINQPSGASTTPELVYMDGDPPTLDIVGNTYCEDIGSRLYYMEIFGELPQGGFICQNYRDNPIPDVVIQVNKEAHESIEAYNIENGIESSVWQHYRLTNVQWEPFDITEIDDDPDSDRNISTYFLNDITIETDYALTFFTGQLSAQGPPTVFPANFDNFDPSRQTYQNVLDFDEEGNLTDTYNMGGCMGCHGSAQLGGADFSFILKGGRVSLPEAPDVVTPGTSNPPPNIKQIGETELRELFDRDE
ncbi:MAG: hypothetical protein RIG61_10205 [Deltaproteobacteria bacterium]